MAIHPQAVVGPHVELADGVEVGPFAVIDGEVRIGPGTRIWPHAYVTGYTSIGANCQVHPGAAIGHLPQDLKFENVRSYVHIGDDVVLREGVTVHRGTAAESTTTLGAGCFLMVNSHVGHNCRLGDAVILTNAALLAGHVDVGAAAIISGNAAVHQFVRIGRLAMVGGLARIEQDVPPFLMLIPPLGLAGVNRIGLKRAGVADAAIRELGQLFKLLFRHGLPLPRALAEAADQVATAEGRELLEFCAADSRRGIERGRRSRRRAED